MTTDSPITVRLSRRFDASPERVFDAWLDPTRAARFLFATPEGTMLGCDIDARVGGRYRIVEKRPQGVAAHWGEYLQIERPHRIVFTLAVEEGVAGDRIELDFAADGAGCVLTLMHTMKSEYAEWTGKTRDGWTHILGSLAAVLSVE
jgi:uncharacterized protein YndB with AHSA1/START domain